MGNFYLLNEAITAAEVSDFKTGVSPLIAIETSSRSSDDFWKHDSVWEMDNLLEILSDSGQEAKAIVKFIAQLWSHPSYLKTEDLIDAEFPNSCNAFLGFDFAGCGIPLEKQICNKNDYSTFLKDCLPQQEVNDSASCLSVLQFLFPDYLFEDQAIEDILYWKNHDSVVFTRLISLIEDCEQNPFTGGLGKTEALKYLPGVASKRINGANRVTYSLKGSIVKILACKGHYDD